MNSCHELKHSPGEALVQFLRDQWVSLGVVRLLADLMDREEMMRSEEPLLR
jgi:hypothetical protein